MTRLITKYTFSDLAMTYISCYILTTQACYSAYYSAEKSTNCFYKFALTFT